MSADRTLSMTCHRIFPSLSTCTLTEQTLGIHHQRISRRNRRHRSVWSTRFEPAKSQELALTWSKANRVSTDISAETSINGKIRATSPRHHGSRRGLVSRQEESAFALSVVPLNPCLT